jgi:hypothetical protein
VSDPPDRPPPSPLDLLGDRRAFVDAGLGPVAFVTTNAIFGLKPAAYAAIGLSLLILLERLVRRGPAVNAVGGLLGTGIAVFIALRTGSAEGYFVPRMLQAAAIGLVLIGSVLIRRPLIGILVALLFKVPPGWKQHPGVRRAASEVTLAWAGLFAVRTVVYIVFIIAGSAGALAAASVVMGIPAFALLLFFTYRYFPRRLTQLGAPVPHVR